MERPGETDWEIYRRLAPVAVPRRAEQLATIVALLPGGTRRVVELGCGEGHLSASILECLPGSSVAALDGSPTMRELAAARLARFSDRAAVHAFDLEDNEWLSFLDGSDVVVSSLALHHLDLHGKERVYREMGTRLSPGGAVVVADIAEPQRAEAAGIFAAEWDRSADLQAREIGKPELHDLFLEEQWNYYRWPDPSDRPSPLYAQLQILERAGFAVVDCFWMYAGHAVFGGYKSARRALESVPFVAALNAVESELGVTFEV